VGWSLASPEADQASPTAEQEVLRMCVPHAFLAVSVLWAALQTSDTPPGMVLVPGGKTTIGSTVEEIETLVKEREELSTAVAAETPRFTLDVPAFYLMPTEVTNEQYAEYVRATQSRPPRSWGVEALHAGQKAFLEEQGRAKQEAKLVGRPFESKTFDPELWWSAHWKDIQWEIPPSELTHPVVYVTYAEAQGYARWAGLRLMTEFEFQSAARGDSARLYPWGSNWDDKKFCLSLHMGRDVTMPVGSFPQGAVGGIHDLAGNVWEWTSSPFEPFPGYRSLRVEVKKRVIDCLAPFDPEQRVTVSGSFQMDRIGVRATTRRNTDRTQSTNALGFRCAASPAPGLDAARWLIEKDLHLSLLGPGGALAPEAAVALREWTAEPGTAGVAGYAVIRSYQHLLACPRKDIHASTVRDLKQITSQSGPIVVGFIDVPRPMAAPELDAGAYFVAWHGAGESAASEGEQRSLLRTQEPAEPRLQDVPGFHANRDCYVFYDRQGVPQAAMEAPPVRIEKLHPSRVLIERYGSPEAQKRREKTGETAELDTLRFTLTVPSATTNAKGLAFELAIQVAPGTYGESWK
jgi:formylglycine-generating enzyme required for sulfatase activity